MNTLPINSKAIFQDTKNLEILEFEETYYACVEGTPDLYLSLISTKLFDHIDSATGYRTINEIKDLMKSHIPKVIGYNDISKYTIKKCITCRIIKKEI
jgi:hypothetical protein